MKLYAVTKGEYSDYHIITLTTNKARAEYIAKKCSDKWDDAKVEEFEEGTDAREPIWCVEFYKDRKLNVYMLSYERQFTFDEDINRVYDGGFHCADYTIFCESSDEEHALKIARDIFAQYCYENNIVLRRKKYSAPKAYNLRYGVWFDAGWGEEMCSLCGWEKKAEDIMSFCPRCFAVMNVQKLYERVVGRG